MQISPKHARLRSQTLVIIGLVAYMLLIGANSGDVTRIADQIASSVGFLGTGALSYNSYFYATLKPQRHSNLLILVGFFMEILINSYTFLAK